MATRPISTLRNGTTTSIMFSMSPPRMRIAATTPPMAQRSFWEGACRRLRLSGRDDAVSECAARRSQRRLAADAFVSFIQNHDQIGNRAFGERLNVVGASAKSSARLQASTCLPLRYRCCSWARNGARRRRSPFSATSRGELAEAVRKGRREEFSRFPEFADPERVAKIPDPCAESTFLASKLDWSRIDATHLAYLSRSLEDPSRVCAAVAAVDSTWWRGARGG